MRSKYTNQELYQWQIGQISGVYFRSYRLAYDLAKRAERCFRFELGLAGQQLHQFRLLGQPQEGPAVRREAAVRPAAAGDCLPGAEPPRVRADQARLAGAARPAGAGEAAGDRPLLLQLPEEIFDLDYPGPLLPPHQVGEPDAAVRRGPVHDDLVHAAAAEEQHSHQHGQRRQRLSAQHGRRRLAGRRPALRREQHPGQGDRRQQRPERQRHVRAELPRRTLPAVRRSRRDQRVVARAVQRSARQQPRSGESRLRPSRCGSSTTATITDAVLHVKYTAREDAGPFKNGAIAHLRDYFSEDGTTRSCACFDLRRDFATQWYRFLNP